MIKYRIYNTFFMNKILVIAGIVVIVIGLILFGTFPKAFYKSAKDINSDDYKDGEKVTVYGTITKLEYNSLIDNTTVELDGNLTLFFNGHLKGYNEGDYVFVTIEKTNIIQFGNWKVSAWKSSEKDMHYVSSMQLYFYILMIIGIILAAIGVIIR